MLSEQEEKNFNTSHVTVYQYIPFYEAGIRKFQYIPCYGLSLTTSLLNQKRWNFNTSHVTVYQIFILFFTSSFEYFNTSHVTVYRHDHNKDHKAHGHFNTSHVTVYLAATITTDEINIFQYIPCYGLSLKNNRSL